MCLQMAADLDLQTTIRVSQSALSEILKYHGFIGKCSVIEYTDDHEMIEARNREGGVMTT